MDVSIIIDLRTIELHSNGSVTGVVYWQVGDIQFPEIGWNDFVVVVVGWWSDAIVRILRGETNVAILRFMDGPFSLAVEVEGDGFKLNFIDERHRRDSASEVHVTRNDLCRAVLQSAKRLCHHCRSFVETTDRIDRLKKSCDALELFLGKTSDILR